MNASPDASLTELLDRLNRGDQAAAELVFIKYEPFLRLLVRRQLTTALRAKFDSQDIVQSVWVDLLHGFQEAGWHFADIAKLRAFLIRATRNRLIDRQRQQHRRQEQPWPTQSHEVPAQDMPGPSTQVHTEDLWNQLLSLCPPTHHDLLLLKRQGCTLDEIAAQTGLHPSSVRRILYDLARKWACRKDALEN